MSPNPPPPLPALPDSVARVAALTVGVTTRRHAGAGLIWRPGVVVASASLLWRQPAVTLVLPDGEPVSAELRGVDIATDLAALTWTATADDTAALPRATEPPRVGDFVFAVGREPSGLVQASFGHVGLVGGAWRSWRGGQVDALIRLDGGLYPGLEGAPVADAEGRLLGIASSAFARHHGVVLPVATVERVLEALLAHGRVAHGYLGLSGQPVRATLDGEAVDGLLVSSVADDGPAARGGLLVGDVIVAIDGTPVASLDALRGRLAVGAAVNVRVARGGRGHDLVLTVAERPRRHCH